MFLSRENCPQCLDTLVDCLGLLNPTACLNTNRPVTQEVGSRTTSTSTNTVAVVYQRFETFTKFKYSTLHWCQIPEIFSIYTQLERARLVCEKDYPGQGWNPTSIYFRTLNIVAHEGKKPYTKVQI